MAVTLKQQNRHDVAKETLRRALTCLQELVGSEGASEFLQSHIPKSEIRSSTGSLMDTTDTMQSDSSNRKVVYGVSIEHPLCNTTTRFLSAPLDNSSNIAVELPVVYESVTTAVLLYNMGLSCHGNAIRRGFSRELRRALQLYKMSIRIVQDDSSLHGEDMLQALLLALLNNNIGCIHSHFYDWNEMRESREVLYSLFASSNDLTMEDNVFFSYVLPVQLMDTICLLHLNPFEIEYYKYNNFFTLLHTHKAYFTTD